MTKYMFSPSTKGFYPADDEGKAPYIEAGSLPDDLKDISDNDYNQFFNPPEGYYSVFDDDGPRIEKIPEPDYVSIAEEKRQALRESISSAIAVWQSKLLMGRKLTAAESEAMNKWLDYSDALEAVDTSTAPDITWPAAPSA